MNPYATPGPWSVVHPVGDRVMVVGARDARSEHAHGHALVTEMRAYTDEPGDTAEGVLADARLIAAAPELLEALRRLFLDLHTECPLAVLRSVRLNAAIDQVRAAIEKAEGPR